jgi:hypothetical protein
MKARKLQRPKSITSFSSKYDLDFTSPYFQHVKPSNPCLTIKNQSVYLKKRVKTSVNQTINNSSLILPDLEGLPQKSLSAEVLMNSDCALNSETFDLKTFRYEETYVKLQERLANLPHGDYKEIKKIYFEVFEELISKDFCLGKILLSFKDGLLAAVKSHYKGKIKKLEQDLLLQKKMVVGLKNEKESFVLKLNNLSSQNIDLINSCEKLEESLKRFEPKNLHHNGSKKEFTSAEIIDKNEIIRELSLKIEEMRSHENKLMQIIQKLNVDGVELQKIYSQTPVKQNLFTIKKRKRVQVPEIDLTKLPVD